MFVAPAVLEARDAFNQEIKARAPPAATPPVVGDDGSNDGGDIISMILSGIFGGIEPTSTRSTTRSTSTSTTTRTSTSTRPTSTLESTSSTRTTPTPVTPPPVQSTSSTPRQTTTITQTVDTGVNNASAANNTSKNNRLPSVVIGVIVAAAVIFGLIFIALIARKIFQAKRRRRRATWAENGISPFQDPVREKALPPPPPQETTQEYASYPAYPPAAVTFANQPGPYSPAAASSAGYPAPYPFGGAGNVAQPVIGAKTNAAMFQSSAYTPADLAGPVVIQQTPPTPTAVAGSGPQLSVVKRTFIPSLPDELSIANGEQVRVLSLYDDGWALCEKVASGEKGVVPQECLESTAPSATTNTPGQQLAGSEESARLNRNSSLRRGQEQTY